MDIVLSTLNARWIHASFGLRYLHANLGELQPRAVIREFTNSERPIDIVEQLLALQPQIIGLGVYVWNAAESLEVVRLLRKLAPEVTVVIGGPEVSHEVEAQQICSLATHVITGEADLAFAKVCRQLLADEAVPHRIAATSPAPDELVLPYNLYDTEDVAHRVLYVEASRGCPYRCEFCLSSLDRGVRAFELEPFLAELKNLYDRGVRTFKFVDRTFNLKVDVATQILQFFLDRSEPTFAHFEMVPDRFPDELRDIVQKFAPGQLQFEVGIQTFDPVVAKRISRRQDYDKLADNLRFLREETSVHVHADLIVGLPGETLESFGRGFDTLLELGPQEIQVGMLKRLRGAPIVRHDQEFGMIWSDTAPYELLANRDLDFATMQRLRRFARYWDLLGNSGNFRDTIQIFWQVDQPFAAFLAFSDWLWAETGATARIALRRLLKYVFAWLTQTLPDDEVGPVMLLDYQRPGRPDVPKVLQRWSEFSTTHTDGTSSTPNRQSKHLESE